jgi:hypothetical protein
VGGVVDERGDNVCNLVYVLVGQQIPWKAPPKHQLPVGQQPSVIRQSMVVLAGNSSKRLVISIPKPSLELRLISWVVMVEVSRRNDARMARILREAAMLSEER